METPGCVEEAIMFKLVFKKLDSGDVKSIELTQDRVRVYIYNDVAGSSCSIRVSGTTQLIGKTLNHGLGSVINKV